MTKTKKTKATKMQKTATKEETKAILVRFPLGEMAALKEAAQADDRRLAQFIRTAVREKIERGGA